MKKALLLGAVMFAGQGLAEDLPGQRFVVDAHKLPRPFATPAKDNGGNMVPRPNGVMPKVPKGFVIEPYISGLDNPRFMALGPDGVFLAQSRADKITLLKGGKAYPFAAGFHYPHGLAVRNGALYVGDLDAVWRIDLKTKARTRVTKDSFGTRSYHITRDIAFDSQGALYIAIGSANNVAEEKPPQATVQKVSPDGHMKTFAAGLRNPVGIAFYPGTDDLYVTANERDGYGDGLPPDFFTSLKAGDFLGWPYAYAGPHPDPDFGAKRPDLVAKTKTPDVLFPAHSTALGLVFYDGQAFPKDYRGDAFIALHGSWNSGKPTGFKVVRVRFKDGRPERGYENFATGFWLKGESPPVVYGRPAGLLVDRDGSLLIADDQGRTVWRVRYAGGR
ncbi:glucose/arabinose dehydrogenase [Rhizomicrobium palustre]|uniref:Glucose/arabinose dehydrogenase n=1 Tax=Rhizomicrobium palustre TaxID=189966 RepID=A0A846MXX1_9PROT|nr:PQQ-dependent sugar dehydrogenase [Rhizomicrobium palustre]NIK88226.1 glucose/arabinose dehydrogenase [Rhizomicrobium palustre]